MKLAAALSGFVIAACGGTPTPPLANRGGALNEIEYSEFVQKVEAFAEGVGAMADFPDMLEVVARARELDTFAGEHDAQLAVHLRSRSVAWSVGFIQQHAARHGFVPGMVPGRLVLPGAEEGAPPVLTLSFDSQAALAEDPNQSALRDVTLSFDVPQTDPASEPFIAWQASAQALSLGMDAAIVDDNGIKGESTVEKLATLKPAFKKDGTITAAASSSINDGAAALVLMRQSTALELGCNPLARIVAHATHAQEPEWFTTAPVGATEKALKKAGWKVEDVDLWEINEAFAVVPMALMADLKVPHEKVNVNGGACALGHPIGASGARILVTLLYALQARGKKKGLATLCIGGGEATAMAIELV